VFLILLFLHSNIQFTFVDGYPVIAGISFMSINARIYLSTWTPDKDPLSHNSNIASPFTVAPMNTTLRSEGGQTESYVMHPVRPVAVQVIVESDSSPEESLKDNSGWRSVV